MSEIDVSTLEKLKVTELKELLLQRALSTTGTKPVLIDRLKESFGASDLKKDDDEDDEDEKEEEEEKPKKRKKSAGKKESSSKKQKTDSEASSSENTTDFSKPPLGENELKIVTWNVASLKSVLNKGFLDYLKSDDPDIICLNETKVSETTYATKFTSYGYEHCCFNSCKKNPGYSGTALLSKIKPVAFTKGIGIETHDEEGRVITAEYDDFYVVATYIPNAGAAGDDKMPKDLKYRGEWDVDFLKYLNSLKEKKIRGLVW